MSSFAVFKQAVAAQFARMQAYPLFRTSIEPDRVWELYLDAFPVEANPMFRERREYDCSCCKQFIRNIGNVVAIVDGKIMTIWGGPVGDPVYAHVSVILDDSVRRNKIEEPFVHYEKHIGTDKTFEQRVGMAATTWQHFHVNLPSRVVMDKHAIPTYLGKQRTAFETLKRAVAEITGQAIDTVLELIEQGSLYRGDEHKAAVQAFKKVYHQANTEGNLYLWENLEKFNSLAGIRNSVIGTLLVDLSEGKDLEYAVKAFETKVAPSNYKRPTALITAGMIAKAKEKIGELGLTSALERRYARIDDLSANDILFADRSSKKKLDGDVFDTLTATASTKPKNLDKVETITIDAFIANVLPKIETMEVLFENKHRGNLVSLIAPSDPTAGQLFKWPNGFSWAYNGDVADSEMRQAVVARGGSVSGVFRFTHQWNYDKRNASLMDLHVFMPSSTISREDGCNNFYGNTHRVGWNHRNEPKSGGVQDVDYTPEAPAGYVPVENITFPSLSRMPEGTYICKIHNWCLRLPTHGGFKAEIEFDGTVYEYEVDRPLKNKEWVTVAEVLLKDGEFTIAHRLPVGTANKHIWGLQTNQFQQVKLMLLSPNHWDGHAIGNKHYFFVLDGAKNDGDARGFFNEFLKNELNDHRKVFEVVGSKMKATEGADAQLSGLGFSSTKTDQLLVKVTGSFTRMLRITF